MTTGRAPALGSSKVAAACCTLLVLMLPLLLALRSVGAPAAPGELARLERVIEGRAPGAQEDTATSALFHTAAIAGEPWPQQPREQQALLVRARVAQAVVLAALGLLVYFAATLAFGRLHGLLACGAFCVLPPVYAAGFVLRPETVGACFALLSVVLMQVAALPAPQRRGRRPREAALLGGGLMACAAVSIAIACEALPSQGASLFVPGIVLLLSALELAARGLRALRRRGLVGTPVRALNRRLVPWTALGFLTPAVAFAVLSRSHTVAVEALAVTAPHSTLLPQDRLAAGALAALAVGGGAVMVGRLGLRLGRGARICPERVLFAYCAVFLLSWAAADGGRDPLPLAPAVALVAALGARAALATTFGLLARLRAAPDRSPT